MIDYTQPPVAYLVRIPQADQDSPLDDSARERADEAARFLSYEQIGPVVASAAAAAVETAEAIFHAVHTTHAGVENDDRLADSIATYLRHREPGPPCVLVCDPFALRAALAVANVCNDDIVAPGGIVSVHRDGEGLRAIARSMILDFDFADAVAMIADAGSQR